ncbi:hypothetical protein CVT25_002561 [Psilocybe cyanescens]|uniref:Ubinuclein middle domain-containing protein n=1 Tax=Psilocybe cyanescens TaxID=93625 RepID=A0A409WLI9_PSICY|nr:hypothetical protein CVT25_002561 [Psilocybe cyanescens]
MPSDVEMHASSPDIHLTPPPSSAATSRRSSVVHAVPVHHSGSAISIPLLVHSPSPSPSHDATIPAASSSTSGTAAPVVADSASASAPAPAAAPSPATKTPSSSSAKPASSAKPRSTKPPKPRSPSPSPPPPVIPLQTIRLDIRLGGPSNYEVDIARQAKDTGQRPPTPPPVVKHAVADSSDSEDDEDDKDKDKDKNKAGEDPKSKTKKRKKKNAAAEYYDTTDPFIDDSELALDERQFFAQTKQQGFYVSSGEVALLKDKTPKKPKSKKISFATGLHPSLSAANLTSTKSTEGTRDAPIAVDGDPSSSSTANANAGTSISAPVGNSSTSASLKSSGPPNTSTTSASASGPDLPHLSILPTASAPAPGAQKRKRQNSIITETGKRKKVVDETLFHPDLQAALRELKALIQRESWENKGKFPPALKPALSRLAVLAIRLDEYDDDFFSLMPIYDDGAWFCPLLAYMLPPSHPPSVSCPHTQKLIKRTVFPDHLALLTERQDVLLAQLKQLATEGFAKAEEEWEKSVVAWDRRQEKMRGEAAEASGTGGEGSGRGTASAAPTRHGTEEMDVDGEGAGAGGGGGGGGGLPPFPALAQDGEGAGKDKDKDKDKDKEHANNPPAKRYRMTDQMKSIVWELVLLSNECCRLENEKNSLEGSVIQISDQGLRKVLYQKIVSAYPDGWMSSGQISRDVSAMKKKLEREAMEQENDD